MMIRTYISLVFVVLANYSFGQGCSDAGFCSAGALQSGHLNENMEPAYSVGLSNAIGEGEKGTMIYIPQLEFKKHTHRGDLELKIPYNIASGDLGSHAGLGDLVFTYSALFGKTKTNLQWMYLLGMRVSTGSANAKDNSGMSLPMVYQSNLGTTDVIAGISMRWKKYISIGIGYQQPILQYNHNDYESFSYFYSKHLKRKGDVLLKAEAGYNWKRTGIAAGPLFIYHLADDMADGPYNSPNHLTLADSKGLTFNITGNISYKWRYYRIDITAGAPLQVRKVRPEGLTREWVIVPRLTYFFDRK